MPRSPSNRSQVPDTAIARHIGLTISYLMSLHSHCSPSLAQILYKLAIVSRATKVSPMDGLITGNYDSTGSLLQSSILLGVTWHFLSCDHVRMPNEGLSQPSERYFFPSTWSGLTVSQSIQETLYHLSILNSVMKKPYVYLNIYSSCRVKHLFLHCSF